MIFLPENTPSLKNSKPNGRFHSPSVVKYLRKLGIQGYSPSKKTVKEYKPGLKTYKPNLFREAVGDYFENREHPIVLGFHFVRDSRRLFDIVNAQHIILDLLTAHQFIEDDNCNCLVPMSMKMNNNWYSVDKNNPGCYLKVLENI